jgi:hypothetical protein
MTELLSTKVGGSIEPILAAWARNENQAQTKEGEDEKFVMWTRKLLAAVQQNETVYRGQIAAGRTSAVLLNTHHQKALADVQTEAKQADSGFSGLFHCLDVEELLRLFLSFSKHFRTTSVFKASFLKGLVQRHGGVSHE